MIKLTALLKAKQGMPRDAFIARYEQQHAPLIGNLIPFFSAYRRSFPLRAMAPEHMESGVLPDDFDVITELWYPDQAAIDRQIAAMEGEIGQKIAEDEEDQFDRSRMVMFASDERVTPPSALRPCPAGHQGPPPIRAVGILRKRVGMTRDDFIAYYEEGHVPLALELMAADGVPLFANYTRSFPIPGSIFQIGTGGSAVPCVGFDVITDMWFWNDADYQAFLARPLNPAVADPLVADEAKLFDRGAIQAFVVEEFITPS